MSKYEVRLLNEPEYSQWDQLVVQSEQGTIFHLSKWIAIAAKFSHSDYVIIDPFSQRINSFILTRLFNRLNKCSVIGVREFAGEKLPSI